MSIQSEITRINNNVQTTLNTIAETGVEVGTNSDALPAAAAALANEKLNKSGGNVTGHIYLTGAKEASSTGNTSQIVFGTSSNNHVAISSNNNALVINPTSSSTTHQIVLYLDKASVFPSGLQGSLTGNASTATKLKTARTITLSGAVSGSASFDGSGNVTISTTSSGGGATAMTVAQVRAICT